MSPKASRKDVDAARRLVRERDGERCQMCNAILVGRLYAVHHRSPKGMGGSALLESPANLVTLCGFGNSDGCHGKAHSNPEWARNHGWIVSRSFDPAEIPVDMHDGWYYLSDDGSRTPCTPSEVPGMSEPTKDQSYCDVDDHVHCSGYTEDELDAETCLCDCHDDPDGLPSPDGGNLPIPYGPWGFSTEGGSP